MMPEIYLGLQLSVITSSFFDYEPLAHEGSFAAHCAVGHERLGEFRKENKICYFTVGVTDLC